MLRSLVGSEMCIRDRDQTEDEERGETSTTYGGVLPYAGQLEEPGRPVGDLSTLDDRPPTNPANTGARGIIREVSESVLENYGDFVKEAMRQRPRVR